MQVKSPKNVFLTVKVICAFCVLYVQTNHVHVQYYLFILKKELILFGEGRSQYVYIYPITACMAMWIHHFAISSSMSILPTCKHLQIVLVCLPNVTEMFPYDITHVESVLFLRSSLATQ